MYLRLFHKGLWWVMQKTVGPKTVSDFVKTTCTILGLDPSGYTSHCFCRSTATNLAGVGVSFVNLKRHGQSWRPELQQK